LYARRFCFDMRATVRALRQTACGDRSGCATACCWHAPSNGMPTLEPVATTGSGDVRQQLWRGENLDALAILTGSDQRFALAYLDPPYNTKRALRYRDRYGNHANWAAYLRPRLVATREVLESGGICAISIDARELGTCLALCDETFGEDHRLGIIVQRVKAAAGLSNAPVMDVCEYLLVYARDVRYWRDRVLHRYEPMTALGEYTRRLVAPTAGAVVSNRDGIVVQEYTATVERVDPQVLRNGPIDGVFCTTNAQGAGRFAGHVPRRGLYRVEYTPSTGVHAGTMRTIWFLHGRVVVELAGHARVGVGGVERRVRETTLWDAHWYQGLGAEGGVRFPNGKKPVAMLQRLLSWVPQDAAVLDPFAGSASMVHAVLDANRIDGGSRQCVAITNDEAGICTEVAWPRIVGVVHGELPDGRQCVASGGRCDLYDLIADPASTTEPVEDADRVA